MVRENEPRPLPLPRDVLDRRASVEQVIERTGTHCEMFRICLNEFWYFINSLRSSDHTIQHTEIFLFAGPLDIHVRSVQEEFDEAADNFVARIIRRASMGGDITPEDQSDSEELDERTDFQGRVSPPEFHSLSTPEIQLSPVVLTTESDEESGTNTEIEQLEEHVTEVEVESDTEEHVRYNEAIERTADEVTDSVIRHAVEATIPPEDIGQVVTEETLRPISAPQALHLAAVLEARDIGIHKRVSFDDHPVEIQSEQILTEAETLSELSSEPLSEVLEEQVTVRRVHSPPPKYFASVSSLEEPDEEVTQQHIPRRVSFDDYPVEISPSVSDVSLSSRETTQWTPHEEAVVEETTPTMEIEPRSAYADFGESNIQKADEVLPKRSPFVPESPYADFGRENIEDAETGSENMTTRRTSYGSSGPAIQPSEAFTEQVNIIVDTVVAKHTLNSKYIHFNELKYIFYFDVNTVH